jgi:hypothetical protein
MQFKVEKSTIHQEKKLALPIDILVYFIYLYGLLFWNLPSGHLKRSPDSITNTFVAIVLARILCEHDEKINWAVWYQILVHMANVSFLCPDTCCVSGFEK